MKTVDQKNTVHALVLDFRKAFDVVPHHLLIQQLIEAGIDNHLIAWIKHFLTGRKQRVVLNGTGSSEVDVTSGVPQGSVVGPKLFLLYINDLPSCVKSQVSLFADDTLMFNCVSTADELIAFQKDIESLERWSDTWGMKFNVAKTKLMIFGKNKIFLETNYILNGYEIDEVDSATYLGVTLQSDLKWDIHISNKVSKASQILGLLKRTLRETPKKTKLLAYTTICRSILEYGCQVWDPHLNCQSYMAVRFICSLRGRTDSVSEARVGLGLKTLEERRRSLRISLLSKILTNSLDYNALSDFTKSYLNPVSSSTVTRSKTNQQLSSLGSSSSVFYNSFLPRTVRDLRLEACLDG